MAQLKFKHVGTDLYPYGIARILIGDAVVDDDGSRYLSSECTSYAQVEEEVKSLKRDLDKILVQARKKFPHR